jgi:hypothetical protein
MDKTSKQIIQGLMNELALERQLADQLADALINGGMDRQFQASHSTNTHATDSCTADVKVGDSPESQAEEAWQAVRSSVNEMATT